MVKMYVPAVAAQRDLTGTLLRVLGVRASAGQRRHNHSYTCALRSSFRNAYTYVQTHRQKPGAKWVRCGPQGACLLPMAPAELTQWELRS